MDMVGIYSNLDYFDSHFRACFTDDALGEHLHHRPLYPSPVLGSYSKSYLQYMKQNYQD